MLLLLKDNFDEPVLGEYCPCEQWPCKKWPPTIRPWLLTCLTMCEILCVNMTIRRNKECNARPQQKILDRTIVEKGEPTL